MSSGIDWEDEHDAPLTKERAVAILKDWIAFARYVSRSLTNLNEAAGIEYNRFARLGSPKRKEVPTLDELRRLSGATGYPLHEQVIQAAVFLDPSSGPVEPPPEPPGECTLTSRSELKLWIRQARRYRRGGKLTQGQLGVLVRRSTMTISAWENPDDGRLPKAKDVSAIAAACNVPVPGVGFDRPAEAADQVQSSARTLFEEILQNGIMLSHRAHTPGNIERNALIFRARYGGIGDAESTLQAIGDAHGITRERVRQIIDKQMSFLRVVDLRIACFNALADACQNLSPMPVSGAEQELRSLLGGDLTLQGAKDYGREVLGRSLPIQFLPVKNGETLVTSGDLPTWFQAATSVCKLLIRHSGAAQLNLAWALTMRQHQGWIDAGQFRKTLQYVPGFDWIDDDEAWFWFGPEGSANRLIKRAIEIISHSSSGVLDIEIIYGGLTRYVRTRTSDVAEEAGVWPPVDVVQKLLAKSPDLVCQQGDDFRLATSVASSNHSGKSGVAESLLEILRTMGGLASRSELYQVAVVAHGMNPVSFSVALAKSPLLRQVDRSIFAIRGWPISAARLAEAQQRIGNQTGTAANFKEVDILSNGDVSWTTTLSQGSLTNSYAGVPRKALIHLPEGQYEAFGETLFLNSGRFVGLVRMMVAAGGVAGTVFKVTANGRSRTAFIEVLAQEDLEDDAP